MKKVMAIILLLGAASISTNASALFGRGGNCGGCNDSCGTVMMSNDCCEATVSCDSCETMSCDSGCC